MLIERQLVLNISTLANQHISKLAHFQNDRRPARDINTQLPFFIGEMRYRIVDSGVTAKICIIRI
jgi:hypothetical protein